jgi:hypothetical protein
MGGKPADIIYSPASIAKRKIPSLVMEIMVNKLLEVSGAPVSITDGSETFEEVAEALAACGVPDDATELLSLNDEPFPNRTLAGPVFLMLLHHHPRAKLRVGGKVTHSFREVQQRGVGQGRLNREELEVLFSTGSTGLMAEIYDTVGKSKLPEHAAEYLKSLGVYKEDETPQQAENPAQVVREKLPRRRTPREEEIRQLEKELGIRK